jgi:hypothetical protein
MDAQSGEIPEQIDTVQAHFARKAKSKALTVAIDQANARFGRDKVRYGLHNDQAPWRMRQE